MDARVKDNARWKNILAFSGREYTKGEWRAVPDGFEEEARSNPYLELRDGQEPSGEPAKKAAKAAAKKAAKAAAKKAAKAAAKKAAKGEGSEEKPGAEASEPEEGSAA